MINAFGSRENTKRHMLVKDTALGQLQVGISGMLSLSMCLLDGFVNMKWGNDEMISCGQIWLKNPKFQYSNTVELNLQFGLPQVSLDHISSMTSFPKKQTFSS